MLQPVLVEKSKETEALLRQVAKDQEEADKVRVIVEAEAEVVGKQAEETTALQKESQVQDTGALWALCFGVRIYICVQPSERQAIMTATINAKECVHLGRFGSSAVSAACTSCRETMELRRIHWNL